MVNSASMGGSHTSVKPRVGSGVFCEASLSRAVCAARTVTMRGSGLPPRCLPVWPGHAGVALVQQLGLVTARPPANSSLQVRAAPRSSSRAARRVQKRMQVARAQGTGWEEDTAEGWGEDTAEGWGEDKAKGDPKIRYFVSCTRGLEKLVAQELMAPEIRAQSVSPGHAGVEFQGTVETGYKANLWLRSGIRVLEEIAWEDLDERMPGGDAVYDFVRRRADWGALVPVGGTFSITSHVWDCSQLSNSATASTRVKDAICDALRDVGRPKPMKPEFGEDVDLPLTLSLYQDRAILYRDLSGASLHKRGYRDAMHKASLNEAVAAGCLQLAGWPELVQKNTAKKQTSVLVDPMCGSGTFLIEAALMGMNVAPGLMRTVWPFHTWRDFDEGLWRKCCEEAERAIRLDTPMLLVGNDLHDGALSLAHKDAHAAGVGHVFELFNSGVSEFRLPKTAPSMVMTNPPWGLRIASTKDDDSNEDNDSGHWADKEEPGSRGEGTLSELEDAWADLGDFMRRECVGVPVNVLCGNPDATRPLRLRAHNRYPVMVGGVDCRLLQYDVLPAPTERAPRSVICNKCGQEGHIAKNCPNRDVCRICGEAGHFARDCKQNAANKQARAY